MTEQPRGEEQRRSPVSIQSYLEGVDYPAEKRELIDRAQQENAPDEVIQTLERLEDRQFDSAAEVNEQTGQQ